MTALRTTVSPKEADLRGRIRFQSADAVADCTVADCAVADCAVADCGYELAEVRHGGFNLV